MLRLFIVRDREHVRALVLGDEKRTVRVTDFYFVDLDEVARQIENFKAKGKIPS